MSMSRWALASGKGHAVYAAKGAGAILELTVGMITLAIVATSGVLLIAEITSLAASGKEKRKLSKIRHTSSDDLHKLIQVRLQRTVYKKVYSLDGNEAHFAYRGI